MKPKQFSPGFRLSKLDVCVLVIGAAAAAGGVVQFDRWTGLAIAFVVLHFFLFCNIVRMSRPLELIWATSFAVLAIMVVQFHRLSWPATFGIAAFVTLILVLIEMRSPSYHGVGWRRINPQLSDWWRAKHGGP